MFFFGVILIGTSAEALVKGIVIGGSSVVELLEREHHQHDWSRDGNRSFEVY